MLKSLEVKDYPLIDHINVEFGKGLNIITGETGEVGRVKDWNEFLK